MNDRTKNSVPNIWAAQENLIHFYRTLSAILGAVCLGLLIVSIVMAFRDPIVVMKSAAAQEFYPSHRDSVSIEKADVEVFAKRFLEALYVWPEYSASSLAKELKPLTEDGLTEKVIEAQSQKYGKDFKGKKLAQSITFVTVRVLDDRVKCSFERILKLEGIPLVVPTEVTLSLIQGAPTRLNPMGIYVTGVQENESAK
jgi:hypothetical protein